jgi:hypothetical protein
MNGWLVNDANVFNGDGGAGEHPVPVTRSEIQQYFNFPLVFSLKFTY